MDPTGHSWLMRLCFTILHIVSLLSTFGGAYLTWHGISQREEEASKQSTWADVLDIRKLTFGKLNRESCWGVALLALGATMNTGLSIWPLWL
jgi:hypothetical protein